jgi:hypothetical protein
LGALICGTFGCTVQLLSLLRRLTYFVHLYLPGKGGSHAKHIITDFNSFSTMANGIFDMGNSKPGGNGCLSLIVGKQTGTLSNIIFYQTTRVTLYFQRGLSACDLHPIQEAAHA